MKIKSKENKILMRILPIICAVLCIATALATPVGAVVNSSQGEFNNYDITSRSTFPLTVGFSYASRDLSTGAGSSYVYSTYVGQYGVEYNQTENGSETYTYKYDAYGDGSTVVDETGELLYTNYTDEWKEVLEVENSGSYRFGKKRISMTNKNFSTGNIAGRQQGVVLRADDIVFNPYTVIDSVSVTVNMLGHEVYEYTYLDDISYAVPCFLTPNPLAYTDNLGIEIIYSWSCDVINANGEKSFHSGIATYDNRIADYQQEVVPIIDASTLANQIGGVGNGGKLSPTIIIQNYYGYIEYNYYEYVAPQIEFTLNGTTYACPDGITWGDYANLDTTEYPASSNADVRWLDSTDGTGMQYNNNGTWQFILYNGEVVENTDTIIGRAVYTLEEIATTDALAGTWVCGSGYGQGNYSWYVNFKSNGENFDELHVEGLPDGDEGISLCYVSAHVWNYVANDLFGRNATFINENYKTITITSKLEEVTNGSALLSWLNTYWTKQVGTHLGGLNYSLDDGPEVVSIDTSTSISTGTWNEVERTESAELVLWYPLIDTSGIIINDSEAYQRWYANYSMPNMTKYVNTFGVEPPDMTFDFTSWIGTAVGGFLNMELMPNFSIGGVLAILIAFSIVMLFLKFFAGG